jgi:hypothetical protein
VPFTPEPEIVSYPPRGVWRRAFGDQWTTPEFRDVLSTWAAIFVERHNWTDRFEIVERIASTGLAVMIPRSARWQLPQKLGEYRQRSGERHIIVRFQRPYLDTRAAEVAIPFEPDGVNTAIETIAILLDVARRAAEAQA